MADEKNALNLTIRAIDQLSGPARGMSGALTRLHRDIAGLKGVNIAAGMERSAKAMERMVIPPMMLADSTRGLKAYAAEMAALSATVMASGKRLPHLALPALAGQGKEDSRRLLPPPIAFDTDHAGIIASMSSYVRGTAAALAPIGAGFAAVDVARTTANFETALVEIRKKAGTTADETERLGQAALDLATGGQVATTIGEVLDAYNRGAAAGLPLADLQEFARLSSVAADAFEMSTADVGDAAAGFSKILKIPMDGMEKYFDLVNSLADSGMSSERDIVNFADRVGSSLKQFGLANEQIAAYGASLLNLKIPAEVAANAMKAFTTRIMAPQTMDKPGRVWLEKLTGGIDIFQEKLRKDANGALLELLDSINELDDISKTDALARIAGGNYNDNIATLVDNLDEVRKNLRLAANESGWIGSLGESYALKLNTMEARWKIFRANLEKLKIDLGSLVLAPAGGFLDEASGAAQEFSSLLKGIEATWQTLKSAATGTAAVGDFVPKGINLLDPTGNMARIQADRLAGERMGELAQKEAGAGALGAHGARDTGGMTYGEILAIARNEIRRTRTETFAEKDRRDFQTTRVMGHRQAEADSMLALKQQFGTHLAPDGQSFRPGTDAMELVDDALSQFANAVLTTIAKIDRAEGVKLDRPTDLGKATGKVAVPTLRPAPAVPLPTARPDFTAIAAEVDAIGARIEDAFAVTSAVSLAAPIATEGGAAEAIAIAAGVRIQAAFDVVARPVIDASSITSALAQTNALAAAIRNLPSASVKGGRVLGEAAAPGALSLGNLPRKAAGGAVRRGLYQVGEQGPEVVEIGQNGYITPNHRLGGGDASGSPIRRPPVGSVSTGPITVNMKVYGSGNAEATAAAVERRLNSRLRRSAQVAINR